MVNSTIMKTAMSATSNISTTLTFSCNLSSINLFHPSTKSPVIESITFLCASKSCSDFPNSSESRGVDSTNFTFVSTDSHNGSRSRSDAEFSLGIA